MTETYNLDKDLVWKQIANINAELDDPSTKTAQANYLFGMLRVWECVLSEGESIPELKFKSRGK